jgi:hypothetical protein
MTIENILTEEKMLSAGRRILESVDVHETSEKEDADKSSQDKF